MFLFPSYERVSNCPQLKMKGGQGKLQDDGGKNRTFCMKHSRSIALCIGTRLFSGSNHAGTLSANWGKGNQNYKNI